jgi:hypothetical protein
VTGLCLRRDQTLTRHVRSVLGLWPRGPSHDRTLCTVVTGLEVVRPVNKRREGAARLRDQTLMGLRNQTLCEHCSQHLVMVLGTCRIEQGGLDPAVCPFT